MQNSAFPEVKGKLGFGCMRLPMAGGKVDIPQFERMADAFLAAGFNYFDTAHGYIDGLSETAVREAVARRHPRAGFLLTNKLTGSYFNRQEEIRPLFEAQLKACGVTYFDFYLMHAQDKPLYEKFLRCCAYETALEMKKEGKIRHFGLSFHDRADVLDRILTDWLQVEAVQIQLNYLDYEDAAVEGRKCYEVCAKHGKPVLVMEPVKGGSLANLPAQGQAVFDALNQKRGVSVSNAGYALRYAAGFPGVVLALSGMSNMQQMEDNLRVMADFKPLDGEEQAAVQAVCRAFEGLNMIACTGCRYCVTESQCPRDILIPDVFACMNKKSAFHDWNQDFYYRGVLTREHGKASDCIACGRCERVCPQHLPIPALMRDVAAAFERKGA